jgi:pimeloyl-ACP methyl ester carboxylesterase
MKGSLEPSRTVLAVSRRSNFVDPSVRYSLQREFEDVAAIANAQGTDVDVFGQSSGATIALGASTLIPRLRMLALYEPPMLSLTESNLTQLEALLAEGRLEEVAESFLRDSVKMSPQELAGIKASPMWSAMVQRAPLNVREEAILRAWNFKPEDLRVLTQPVLLLIGGKTPATHHHRGYLPLLQGALRSLKVYEIPGQEHAAHLTAPELLAEILMDFLED